MWMWEDSLQWSQRDRGMATSFSVRPSGNTQGHTLGQIILLSKYKTDN